MEEGKERTSEELQELRRKGLAPHSPVATRLLVSSSVLIVVVLVIKDITLSGATLLEQDSVLRLLGKFLSITAAVSLGIGLLSPLAQRAGLIRAVLLKPTLRPFPDRVRFSLHISGFVVAIFGAGCFGYRFAGTIFSSLLGPDAPALERLGQIVATEARWLAAVCSLIAIVAAVLARLRFLRSRR